jgi:pantetheine-phosphate adenylyltransferase
MVRAIYAGSFDPITNGHLDIIKRSFNFCDELIIAIGVNPNKTTLFSDISRKRLIEMALKEQNIEALVVSFENLLVDYAKNVRAKVLIRGIRSVSDFEYEINLANVNKTLAPEIETVFIPTSPDLAVVSSSMVKEIARCKGDVSKFVPKFIISELKEQLFPF